MANELTVQVRGLVKEFGERRVLDGLDLAVRRGEFVALLGRSGSGKSTLLRILSGLDGDITGESIVDGTVSVAFQQPRLLDWRKVWRNVVLGLKVDRRFVESVLLDLAGRYPEAIGRIVETTRNLPVRNLYRDNGFALGEDGAWRRKLEVIHKAALAG